MGTKGLLNEKKTIPSELWESNTQKIKIFKVLRLA